MSEWVLNATADEVAQIEHDHDVLLLPVITCHIKNHTSNGCDCSSQVTVCESCSVCDFGWHRSVYDNRFSYCPNCGAKVVE